MATLLLKSAWYNFLLKSFFNVSLGHRFVISISKLPPIPNFKQIRKKQRNSDFLIFWPERSIKYKMTSQKLHVVDIIKCFIIRWYSFWHSITSPKFMVISLQIGKLHRGRRQITRFWKPGLFRVKELLSIPLDTKVGSSRPPQGFF